MQVDVVEQLGDYGGTWRTFHIGADLLFRRLEMNYYGLTRWNQDSSKILPGLAESWRYMDGGCTIELSCARACAGPTGNRSRRAT